MSKIKEWIRRNAAAVALVLVFIAIYIASYSFDDSFLYWGTTGMQYLGGEYYRWITCLFLHYNLRHLLGNCIALLSVSSLLNPFLSKGQTLFLFLSSGILSEIAFSAVISERIYDIGASSGVFALIACLIVCRLRFHDRAKPAWYRPDTIITAIYFIFANSSVSAFLVHVFGFASGTLISFVMAATGWISISIADPS